MCSICNKTKPIVLISVPQEKKEKEISSELTSVAENPVDTVFGSSFVFLDLPFFHFIIILIFISVSTKFTAQHAADGTHCGET